MTRTGRPRTAEWTRRVCACGCGTEFDTPAWDSRKYVDQEHYFAAKAANKKPQPDRVPKAKRVCTFVEQDGSACPRPHKGHGYCDTHLKRVRRHGDVNIVEKSGARKRTEPRGLCSVDPAHGEIDSLGLCHNCYMRQHRRGGDPAVMLPRGRPATLISERVGKWKRMPDGCLNWQGSTNPKGYGKSAVAGRAVMTHRAMYEEKVGPVPEGMQLDHLCANERCGEPEHLEPVTEAENIFRGGRPHFELRGTIKGVAKGKTVQVNIGTTTL